MTTLVHKITDFLSISDSHVVSVSQQGKRLSKNTLPKYAFSLDDIEQIYGNVEGFIKSLPEKGFTSGATLMLRRYYQKNGEMTYHNHENITLNFQKSNAVPDPTASEPVSYAPMPAPMPVAGGGLSNPYGMGYVPVLQNDWLDSKVIAQRFEDIKRENQKLDEQLQDAKSEIRNLKEENFSLRLKNDTLEEKHAIKLEREEIKRKGFWETEAGKGLMGVFEKVAQSSAPMLVGIYTSFLNFWICFLI